MRIVPAFILTAFVLAGIDSADATRLQAAKSANLFVTHPHMSWDHDYQAKPKIDKILRYFIENELDHFVLKPGPRNTKELYLDQLDKVNLIVSNDGEHNLTATTNKLVFAGGNLTACQCETIRDAVALSHKAHDDIFINILTDASYEGYLNEFFRYIVVNDPNGLAAKKNIREFVQREFVGMSKRNYTGGITGFSYPSKMYDFPHSEDEIEGEKYWTKKFLSDVSKKGALAQRFAAGPEKNRSLKVSDLFRWMGRSLATKYINETFLYGAGFLCNDRNDFDGTPRGHDVPEDMVVEIVFDNEPEQKPIRGRKRIVIRFLSTDDQISRLDSNIN